MSLSKQIAIKKDPEKQNFPQGLLYKYLICISFLAATDVTESVHRNDGAVFFLPDSFSVPVHQLYFQLILDKQVNGIQQRPGLFRLLLSGCTSSYISIFIWPSIIGFPSESFSTSTSTSAAMTPSRSSIGGSSFSEENPKFCRNTSVVP